MINGHRKPVWRVYQFGQPDGEEPRRILKRSCVISRPVSSSHIALAVCGSIQNCWGCRLKMYDREYQKQYWKKNKKKIQAQRRMMREELNAYQKEYYRKNREKLLEYMAKWRKENPDKIQKYIRKAKRKKQI
jgi:hypothetical protein